MKIGTRWSASPDPHHPLGFLLETTPVSTMDSEGIAHQSVIANGVVLLINFRSTSVHSVNGEASMYNGDQGSPRGLAPGSASSMGPSLPTSASGQKYPSAESLHHPYHASEANGSNHQVLYELFDHTKVRFLESAFCTYSIQYYYSKQTHLFNQV